jgi:hypothetical protein
MGMQIVKVELLDQGLLHLLMQNQVRCRSTPLHAYSVTG